MEHYDILIVGGGAAGMAAAGECSGARVLLADRGEALGGVLRQCTHRGFGDSISGVEYAAAMAEAFPRDVELALNTTVLSVTAEKTALLSGGEFGRKEVCFDRLILAAGCREIPMGALPIGGTRPGGIYTAGQMQQMMNLHGFTPEGPVVILGSGDIGLIMARQLAEKSLAVTLVEKSGRCGGNRQNQRCLKEYPIRLICGDTLSRVHGSGWITGCTTEQGKELECKCLLIAVGLTPERELVSHLGQPEWLHLCGNCSTVHSMVESVVEEGILAGQAAMSKVR